MTFKRCAVGLAFVVLGGCSSPYKEPLPSDVKGLEEKSFQSAIQKLPDDDRRLLAGYVMRATLAEAFGSKAERVKTVGEAIETQRTWIADEAKKEAEAKALAARVEAARATAVEKMAAVLTVAVLSKKSVPADIYANRFEETIAFRIAFENKTARELTGVKGDLEFRDMFGDKVKTMSLTVDETIGAGKPYVWEGSTKRNQFDDGSVKLGDTPLERLKIRWIPEVYIFADGTEVRMPATVD